MASLKNLHISTRPLTKMLRFAGSQPKVAIRLPEVVDIISETPFINEKPGLMRALYPTLTKQKKIYVRLSPEPGDNVCIGEIVGEREESSFFEKFWWFICDSHIDAQWLSREFIDTYFRFDSMDLVYTLYGEFVSSDGYNAGNDWSGIIIKPWTEIDLHDSTYHFSPVTNQFPFLLKLPHSVAIPDQQNPQATEYLSKCDCVPVYFHDVLIGHAEGFRWVVLGHKCCWRFILSQYNPDLFPWEIYLGNHLIISKTEATITAGKDPILTRLEVDYPPSVMN